MSGQLYQAAGVPMKKVYLAACPFLGTYPAIDIVIQVQVLIE
jgi:hypothetical protein